MARETIASLKKAHKKEIGKLKDDTHKLQQSLHQVICERDSTKGKLEQRLRELRELKEQSENLQRMLDQYADQNKRTRECLETLRDMKYPGQYYPQDASQPWSDSPPKTPEDEIFRALSRIYSFTF